MDPQAGWRCKNATILLIGMQISSHKHSQAAGPVAGMNVQRCLAVRYFLTTVKTMST